MVRRHLACALLLASFWGCAGPSAEKQVVAIVETGISYRDLDEAAKAVCQRIMEQEPLAQKYEFCGSFLGDGDRIRITVPKTDHKAAECSPDTAPDGMTLLGWWHSHRITAEPSLKDRAIAGKYPHLGNYLCSPSGIVRRYSPQEGTVIVR